MHAPTLQLAKCAFVMVLMTVATAYRVGGAPNRDSDDAQLVAFYRKLLLKAHPDKGGRNEDFQGLQSAREAWEDAKQRAAPRGRPSASSDQLVAVGGQQGAGAARVRGVAVLLTYSGRWSVARWKKFLVFVQKQLRLWLAIRWCSTLEMSDASRLHVHLTLQFRSAIDRLSSAFSWDGLSPNASSHDYLGQGLTKSPKFFQSSVDRAFFYVWADKEGTQRDRHGNICVVGDHVPCWEKLANASR